MKGQSILNGTLLGMGTVAYSTTPATQIGVYKTDGHYFYEAQIPVALLGSHLESGDAFDVHWTLNCANDSMIVDPALRVQVPEPGTLALPPPGRLGMVGLARRRRD